MVSTELYLMHDSNNSKLSHEEIKEWLSTRNASNLSVQNVLLSHFLTWNINIKIHKAVIVSYGCQTLSLPLTEEHWMKVIKNVVLKKTFKYKRKRVTKS
jgi:hypothetical protein